jgi:ribosome biogenesis GTPase
MITFDFDRLQGIGLTPEIVRRAHTSALVDDEAAFALVRVAAVHRETVHSTTASASGARACGRGSCAAASTPRPRSRSATGCSPRATMASVGARSHQPISHIARRDGDGSRHPVVSNVDRALIVMGLDDDFNPRRLERYPRSSMRAASRRWSS